MLYWTKEETGSETASERAEETPAFVQRPQSGKTLPLRDTENGSATSSSWTWRMNSLIPDL